MMCVCVIEVVHIRVCTYTREWVLAMMSVLVCLVGMPFPHQMNIPILDLWHAPDAFSPSL